MSDKKQSEEAKREADYASLKKVLMDAYDQASKGKGHDRHAEGLPFEEQIIFKITDQVGTGFLRGQAIKKILESKVLIETKGREAAYNEILGAIVYLAALARYIIPAKDKTEADREGTWVAFETFMSTDAKKAWASDQYQRGLIDKAEFDLIMSFLNNKS